MIFGKRLPEVAMRAAAHIVRLRRSLGQLWREAGLEQELRRVRRDVERDVARLKDPLDLLMFGGCCFLSPRAMVDEIGFFDERFPLYFEDTDLAMRVRRAGKRIVRVPGACVVHLYDRSAATAMGSLKGITAATTPSCLEGWGKPLPREGHLAATAGASNMTATSKKTSL